LFVKTFKAANKNDMINNITAVLLIMKLLLNEQCSRQN